MKITLSFKTPDAGYDARIEAQKDLRNKYLVDHDVESEEELTEAQDEELAELLVKCQDDVEAVCAKFLTYDEYVTVELDTETQTAVVIPAKQ
jgi:hypothetical protein